MSTRPAAKVFVATYRVRGRQRFYTLGRYGELTLHQARTEALDVLSRARQGEDPSGERGAYRRAPTVRDLEKRYMEEHSRATKKPAGIRSDELHWRVHVLPRLGDRKVADLSREDIEGFRPLVADRPATFNSIRRVLSSALNFAEVWGWRPEGSNPCRHVKPFKMKSRQRYLSPQELVRLSEVLAEVEETGEFREQFVLAVRLLLLTGCRSGEIRTLQWQHVDLERQCLRLPDSKTGSKLVYLNDPALQLLTSIDRCDGNPYVLPGVNPGKPIGDLRSPWTRLRKKAGLDDVRLHDLRHTFASFGVGMGLTLQMVGKLLGHADVSATQIYAHLADDPVREANERIGAHIAVLLGESKAEAEPAARV